MSYLADIYRNFDAHFAEENASIVSFPTCTELGRVVFLGNPGSGKHVILSQLSDRFKVHSGSPLLDEDIRQAEIHNVIFKVPIIDCPQSFAEIRPELIFDGCRILIIVVDSTTDLPIEMLDSVNRICSELPARPEVHVFLNKSDMLEAARADSVIADLTDGVNKHVNNCSVHRTSINDGTAMLEVSRLISALVPKREELMNSITIFAKSLELSHAFLVDVQSRIFLFGHDLESLDPETFAVCENAIDSFVGLVNVMDSRSAESVASIELQDGTFVHMHWLTYDVLLVGVSTHEIPSATAKNNVFAFLHSAARILQ